jgi:hypothetical protein
MTRSWILKKKQKSRFVENMSLSKNIIQHNAQKLRILQKDLVSSTNRTANNEYFAYAQRSSAGPSYKKLTSFLEQTTTSIDEDISNHNHIIHTMFLFQLMRETICKSCRSVWDGDISVVQREGTICIAISHDKSDNYVYFRLVLLFGIYLSLC